MTIDALKFHLKSCVQQNNVKGLRKYLDKGGDIDIDLYGYSLLSLASLWGKSDLVEYLIMRGANVNVERIGTIAPLECAVFFGYTSSVRLLLQHKANVNQRCTIGQRTPLDTATSVPHRNKVIIEMLLEADGDCTVRDDSSGKTQKI